MLSIGKLVLGQQRYYEQQVAQGRDDYYSGRGEAPGEWAGGGAEELGLAGQVSAGQFNALLEGRDPRAPETPAADWRQRADDRRVRPDVLGAEVGQRPVRGRAGRGVGGAGRGS